MRMTSFPDKVLFIDIETNGFLYELDTLLCLGYKTAEDAEPRLLIPSKLTADEYAAEAKHMMAWFDTFDVIVAHNGIGFDFPALFKLWKWKPKATVVDTLVLSSLFYPDIAGGHSLKAWGERLKLHKGDYDGGFEQYSDDMGVYCEQDVRVLERLYNVLINKYGKVGAEEWDSAIELEHDVARLIAWQERNGWHFNKEAAESLVVSIQARINSLDEHLGKILGWKCVPHSATGAAVKPFKADGSMSQRCLDFIQLCVDEGLPSPDIGAEFCRIIVKQPDLGSRVQMIELLQEHGWKPTEYTDKGNPKFTEDSIVGKLGETGQALVDRFVCVTRRGQVQGWLSSVRDDGRIVAGAMPNATPTARMRHRTVVNVPRVGTPYGEELRALFCVPAGRVQVGADASGLELRLLAHYMGDPAYTKAVVEGKSSDGSDVHTVNCIALGLEPKKLYEYGGKTQSGRDLAKGFILKRG